MNTISDLLKILEYDHETMMMNALMEVAAKACFKKYSFSYRGQNYDVVFNLLTFSGNFSLEILLS